MTSYWTAFLDFIYPPKCPACKARVHEQGAWCQACLANILSPRQINVLAHGLRALDSCQVICEYQGALKRIIHDMKFRQQRKYTVHLSWLLQYVHLDESSHQPLVIPVPLHRERLRERGYNQAEAIFKRWAKEEKLLWQPELLERIRYTIPQWELNLRERRQNMRHAFVIPRPEKIKKQHIILVDDIVTTGITLEECAAALKKAGAVSVRAVVIASGA